MRLVETIDKHRNQFRQRVGCTWYEADEALNQVQYFIDDAILVGASQVRILHGKRQWYTSSANPTVSWQCS